MQCLFCKKTIPLLRRLKDSEFCSEDHRKQYVKEQSLLALESLVSGDMRNSTRSRNKTLTEVGVGSLGGATRSGNGGAANFSNRRGFQDATDTVEEAAQQASAYSAALEAAHTMASSGGGLAHDFRDSDDECPNDDLLFDALSNISSGCEPLLPPAGEPRRFQHSGGISTQLHEAMQQASVAAYRGLLSPVSAIKAVPWGGAPAISRRRVLLLLRREDAGLITLSVSARTGEKGEPTGKTAAIPLNWLASSIPAMARLTFAIQSELAPPPPVIPPIAPERVISFEPVIHGSPAEPLGQPEFESLTPRLERSRAVFKVAQVSGLALAGAIDVKGIELPSFFGVANSLPGGWVSLLEAGTLRPKARSYVPRLALPGKFLARFEISKAVNDSGVHPRSAAGTFTSITGIEAIALATRIELHRLTLPTDPHSGFAMRPAFRRPVILHPKSAGVSQSGHFEQEQFSIPASISALVFLPAPSALSQCERVDMELEPARRAPESIRFEQNNEIRWPNSEPHFGPERIKVEGAVNIPPPQMAGSLKVSVTPLRAVSVFEFAEPAPLQLNPRALFHQSNSTVDLPAVLAMTDLAFRSSLRSKRPPIGLGADPALCSWPGVDPQFGERRLDLDFSVDALSSIETGIETGKCCKLTPSSAKNLTPTIGNQYSLVPDTFPSVPAVGVSTAIYASVAGFTLADHIGSSESWLSFRHESVPAHGVSTATYTSVAGFPLADQAGSGESWLSFCLENVPALGASTAIHASVAGFPLADQVGSGESGLSFRLETQALEAQANSNDHILWTDLTARVQKLVGPRIEQILESAPPPMAPASPLPIALESQRGEVAPAGIEAHSAFVVSEAALPRQCASTVSSDTSLSPAQAGPVGTFAPPEAVFSPVSLTELADLTANLRHASGIPAMLARECQQALSGWKENLEKLNQAAASLRANEIPATLAAAAAACGSVSWRTSAPISTCHVFPLLDTLPAFKNEPTVKPSDAKRLEIASRPTGHARRLRNSDVPVPAPPVTAPPAENLLGRIPTPLMAEPATTPEAEKTVGGALPPMAGLVAMSASKPKKSIAKINYSLGPLQVLIPAAPMKVGLKPTPYEPANNTEDALRQQIQERKQPRGFSVFWRNAPADLKWITLSLPVVLGVWMLTSGRSNPKPVAPIPAETEVSANVGITDAETASAPVVRAKARPAANGSKEIRVKGEALPTPMEPSKKVDEGSWSQFKQRIAYRSAIAHEEDFRSGLSQWEGRAGWAGTWSYDRNGLLRAGQLALFSPSLELTDYHLEVTGSLDRRSFAWVFRAVDMNNYYGGRLVETRPGPLPTVTLERFIVAGGKKIKSQFFPVPLSMRGESIFTVAVEVAGNSFTTSVQGQIVDSFNDDRWKSGGVGLFALKGEESRIFRISLTHNNDLFGRLCAMIAPRETISPGGRAK